MPTYEYECTKCHKTFELFQSMKDAPLTTCSKELCRQERWGKGKVKRMFGRGAGLIFKGSGFYATDYRSDGYKAAQKKDSAAASGGKSDAKTAENKAGESKPADSKPAEGKPAESKTAGKPKPNPKSE